jgi:predicted dehydrogenase
MNKNDISDHASSRRKFLKTGTLFAAGAGLGKFSRAAGADKAGAPARSRREEPYERPATPGSDVRVACIGVDGAGWSGVTESALHARIVAFADIDFTPGGWTARAQQYFPEIPRFTDYRVMFDKMAREIDAVTIAVPDHSHYPAAMLAMMNGKHVFVQKPLSNSIWECRQMLLAARKYKVVTQMGIQGHTYEGMRLLKEWFEAGAIGRPEKVRYWTNRPTWPQGPGLVWEPGEAPPGLNWDVWQGTVATERPFSNRLHPFKWRGSWDYGCGALGDIGCHLFDAAFWAFGLDVPSAVEVGAATPFDDNAPPTHSVIRYTFTTDKNGRKRERPIDFHWSDGGLKPPPPEELGPGRTLEHNYGQLIYGSRGRIYAPGGYCKTLRLIPEEEMQKFAAKLPPKKYPRVLGGPIKEWIDAILKGTQPGANFEYSSKLSEIVLLGNLAIRLGRPIEWDSKNLKVKGIPEADALIKRQYRRGWEFPVMPG